MSAEVVKLSGAALCPAPPIGGLLAHDNFRPSILGLLQRTSVWMCAIVKLVSWLFGTRNKLETWKLRKKLRNLVSLVDLFN